MNLHQPATSTMSVTSPFAARATVMAPERWEHGSDFHQSTAVGAARYPWDALPNSTWGTGRDALRALLRWGRERHGWRRLHVPSYFCQDVLAPIAEEYVLTPYPDTPGFPAEGPVEVEPGDLVLVSATFGVKRTVPVHGATVVIEDHSHDPLALWAHGSESHYAIASLRKTLPLPDGAALWSPRGLEVPAGRPATPEHRRAVLDRLSGMALKRLYLEGAAVPKDEVRRLLLRGERALGEGEISGMSEYSQARLSTFPADEWRQMRAANLAAFRAAVGDIAGVRLLDVPFAATLVFDAAGERDRVRSVLIDQRIYPAVLWPLSDPVVPGIPARDVQLADRILSLHCDHRYGEADMRRVARVVIDAVLSR